MGKTVAKLERGMVLVRKWMISNLLEIGATEIHIGAIITSSRSRAGGAGRATQIFGKGFLIHLYGCVTLLLVQGVDNGSMYIETGFSRLSGITYVFKEMFLEGDVSELKDSADIESLVRLFV